MDTICGSYQDILDLKDKIGQISLDKINVMYDYDVRTAVGLSYQVLGI